MKRLSDYFAEYASFHKTPGNQMTHYGGIPMIMVGLLGILSRAVLYSPEPGSLAQVDLGLLLWLGSAIFYWRLDWRLGVPFSLVTLGLYFVGRGLPLGVQIGLFVLGWGLQLLGHHYFEKKKPAFLDNLLHLFIGPLWIFSKIFRPIGVPGMSALIIMVSLLAHPVLAEDELDPASVEAMMKTQQLLKDPKKRDQAISESANAKLIDGQIRSLLGDGAHREEFFSVAGEVFEYLTKVSGGDSLKMIQILKDAKNDPKSFYEKLSPKSRQTIRELSNKAANKDQPKRRPASTTSAAELGTD